MNKIALVTGSSKGIGRAIIIELAKAGYDCVINYSTSFNDALKTEEIAKGYNVRTLVVKADVSNEDEVNNMFNVIEKELGEVSILVNNAGIDLSNLYNLKTKEAFTKTLDTNLVGAFLVSKRAAPNMIKNKWGRIINISSTNGINTYYPMSLEYDASKAGLISLTHNLAMEYKPYINVNAIAPGFIGTESELDGYDDIFLKEETSKIFKERYGEAAEVGYLVKFLVSDEAEFINNQVIRIDGGQYGD